MKPIGPLMREHRLIEKLIAFLKKEIKHIKTSNEIDTEFLIVAVDFIRTYADRTHHGKEEYILFRDLALKDMSQEHKNIMNELIEEHTLARNTVTRLAIARERYLAEGSESSKDTIVACLEELVSFYPPHIEKEDKHFFYPCLEYLNELEQQAMLKEFWEFDKNIIHEKYQKTVDDLEKNNSWLA